MMLYQFLLKEYGDPHYKVNMNKIIFLDIDGVLATNSEYFRNKKKFHEKYPLASELFLPYPFNSRCVDILNEIIINTDADIVLSSQWQEHWTLKELDIIFKFNGVFKSPIDITKQIIFNESPFNRYEKIKEYIDLNNIKTYVIIDDLDLSSFNDSNFIRTNDKEGIKQCGLKYKIIEILNKNESIF